jgi:hypothetical protein
MLILETLKGMAPTNLEKHNVYIRMHREAVFGMADRDATEKIYFTGKYLSEENIIVGQMFYAEMSSVFYAVQYESKYQELFENPVSDSPVRILFVFFIHPRSEVHDKFNWYTTVEDPTNYLGLQKTSTKHKELGRRKHLDVHTTAEGLIQRYYPGLTRTESQGYWIYGGKSDDMP